MLSMASKSLDPVALTQIAGQASGVVGGFGIVLIIIGLIGNGIYVYFGQQANRAMPSLVNLISLAGQTFGAPALALFYMASLTLLAERPVWRGRLAPLANAGRMALTNYLLQSLVCTILFYGYGFGLYGRIGAAGGIVLTAAIFLVQVALSTWWLGRFRFGPMEWLWRTLTYGKRQEMRTRLRIAD